MTLTPQRRQFDFCRFRLYKPIMHGVYFLNTHIKNKTVDTIRLWRNCIKDLQRSSDLSVSFLSILHKHEPDIIKIIQIGVSALENLSGLFIKKTRDPIDYSVNLWTFICRIYYEHPYDFLYTADTCLQITNVRTCVDQFISEQCQISESSTCPTTITATNYRLDCLMHKLNATCHVLYKAMLHSTALTADNTTTFTEFQQYIQRLILVILLDIL